MSYEIICPYCFGKMQDDQVMFRSERVNHGEDDILPDDYDDLDDFNARYRGANKEEILSRYRDWEFFTEGDDPEYTAFWNRYNGTTEYNPADEVLRVRAYRRKVIDPGNSYHQRYLKKQPDGSFLIRDGQGMVTQVELTTGERCNRRVCRHCHNPLPDNYGKSPVKFATVIGITGAGKTVYLSQLLRAMRSYATKVGLTAVVNNPGVRTFLEKNEVVQQAPLPGSTPATRFQQPLFYEMTRNAGEHGRVTETFVLYDVAGEVFKEATLVEKFAPFVRYANGVLVLIDPMQFQVVSEMVDHSLAQNADKKALDEPSTVLDVIHGLVSGGNTRQKCRIPFAICISKADIREVQEAFPEDLRRMLLDDVHGMPDPSGFNRPLFNAKEYNPIAKELNRFIQQNELVLAQQMQTNYDEYSYFAFTALGCDVQKGVLDNGQEYQYPVGPVLPKRVEEPILWLFHKLGYIGLNEALFDPVVRPVCCPQCGGENTCPLPDGGKLLTSGWGPFRRRQHVNYECRSCGHLWEQTAGVGG